MVDLFAYSWRANSFSSEMVLLARDEASESSAFCFFSLLSTRIGGEYFGTSREACVDGSVSAALEALGNADIADIVI